MPHARSRSKPRSAERSEVSRSKSPPQPPSKSRSRSVRSRSVRSRSVKFCSVASRKSPPSTSSPPTATPLSIININAWGEPTDLPSRHFSLTKSLLSTRPSVVTIQELFSPYSRRMIDEGIGQKYHRVHAYHPIPSFSLLSHIPAAVFYMGAKCVATQHTWLPSWLPYLAIALVPATWLIVWNFFVVNLFIPKKYMGPGYTSWMGGCIAFDKSHFASARTISLNQFGHAERGYFNALSKFTPGALLFFWIQHTFFRPGYTIAEGVTKTGGKVCVVNCHLILGQPNPCRPIQVAEILKAVRELPNTYETTIIAGDFNASAEDPFYKLLKKDGFVDSVDLKRTAKAVGKYDTWSMQNKYYEEGEGESRIDFVFVKQQVKGRVTKVKGTHDICFGAGEEVSDHFGVLVKLE